MNLKKLPDRIIRLAILPLAIPHLLVYHLLEVMWNGPGATGFWWKCKEFVKGLDIDEEA